MGSLREYGAYVISDGQSKETIDWQLTNVGWDVNNPSSIFPAEAAEYHIDHLPKNSPTQPSSSYGTKEQRRAFAPAAQQANLRFYRQDKTPIVVDDLDLRLASLGLVESKRLTTTNQNELWPTWPRKHG